MSTAYASHAEAYTYTLAARANSSMTLIMDMPVRPAMAVAHDHTVHP